MLNNALQTTVHLMTGGVLRPAIAGCTSLRSLELQPGASASPSTESLKEPVSEDMAIMLDDIRRAQERDRIATSVPAGEVPAEKSAETADHAAPPAKPAHEDRVRRTAHHLMTAGHLALEGLEMANILGGAYLGGVAGSAALSLGMFALGTSHIAETYREKSVEQLIEGTGASLLGVKAGLSALHHAGYYANHETFEALAHTTHSVLVPLAVAHGLIEAGLGGYRVYEGVHEHDSARTLAGALGIGLGCSMATAALGGGVPAMVVAATFFAGKVLCEESGAIQRLLNGQPEDAAPDSTPTTPLLSPQSTLPTPLLSSWHLY